MKSSLRVVIADDEPEMQTHLRETLEDSGHRVVGVAGKGRELVERCREERPDLVIADIKMPGLDGIDAAREIYQERAVPVILVSAYHDPELIERAESDHVMAYLVKPIRAADLEPAIAIALARFEQLEALKKESGGLRQALEDRKIIERAKGLLMKQVGLDEAEAFKRLQDLASTKHRKMVEIAKGIVELEDAFEPNRE